MYTRSSVLIDLFVYVSDDDWNVLFYENMISFALFTYHWKVRVI